MSVTDSLTTELQAVANGIGVAAQAAAAADATAENIAQHSAAQGFTGIAQSMARVRQVLQEARSQLAAAAATAGETTSAVAAIPQQMTPQQTIAVLTPLLSRLDAVDGAVTGAGQRTAEARQATLAALEGGQPDAMLARLNAIVQPLAGVGQRTTAARQHVQEAITAARQAGSSGN